MSLLVIPEPQQNRVSKYDMEECDALRRKTECTDRGILPPLSLTVDPIPSSHVYFGPPLSPHRKASLTPPHALPDPLVDRACTVLRLLPPTFPCPSTPLPGPFALATAAARVGVAVPDSSPPEEDDSSFEVAAPEPAFAVVRLERPAEAAGFEVVAGE